MIMKMMMTRMISARLNRDTFVPRSLALGLLVALVCFSGDWTFPAGASSLVMPKFANIFHEKTGKELRMNFKVFLTNMKVRQVPLAKAHSEQLLTKLYREERLLKEQIEDLNRNLRSFNDKQRRQALRVLEVDKSPASGATAGGSSVPKRNLVKVSELTQARVDQWNSELKEKTLELEEVRSKINESKNIIKHPDSYIAIPNNYGRMDPEDVQDREREILIKDRETMDYRHRIETGEEELPAFMADHW